MLFQKLCVCWPDLYNLGDVEAYRRFWQHEWIEHGEYSGLSPVEYFETVLRLHEEVEARPATVQMLTNLRYFGYSVPVWDLAQYVKTEMGVSVEVHAISGERVTNNVTHSLNVLNEFRYLVNRYYNFIDTYRLWSGLRYGHMVVRVGPDQKMVMI